MRTLSIQDKYPRDQEFWLPVIGRESIYEVSSLGRVRSLSRAVVHKMKDGRSIVRIRKERILKPTISTGYPVVMTLDGPLYVHSMVLEAFVGPRPIGLLSLHFDDDPENCWVGNLRWGTPRQNVEDAKRNGRKIGAPIGNKNRIGGKKYYGQLHEGGAA